MARIAKRYAKALFSLTSGDLAKARGDRDALSLLTRLFAEDCAGKVLCSPVMPVDLKKTLLDYGLDQGEAGQEVRSLIAAVIGAGRVAFLPQIAEEYAKLIDEAEGVAKADVVTAVALGEAEVQQLKTTLAGLLKKQVEVRTKVDPALLGGFVARTGNHLIDLSLKTKLEGLTHSAVQETR